MSSAFDTKAIDTQGRLLLGKRFAGRHVIVQVMDEGMTEFRVTLARVIPERETWLYENPAALEAVRAGLDAARRADFVDAPDFPDMPDMDKARSGAGGG